MHYPRFYASKWVPANYQRTGRLPEMKEMGRNEPTTGMHVGLICGLEKDAYTFGRIAGEQTRLASIIVPTLNGGDHLSACLQSVREQSYRPLEIIVVDNASTDGSQRAALEQCPVIRLVQNDKNVGFAKACNQGAAVARGDFLVFLNNDATITPNALEHLISSAEKGGYEILQPLLLAPDGFIDSAGDLFTWAGFFWHQQRTSAVGKLFPVFSVKGACMLVKRAAFKDLGGFNESYFAYFEEADLCWRARMAGYEVGVASAAHALHKGGGTTRRVLEPRQIYYLAFRNRLRSIIANPSPHSLLRLLPLHLVGCLATAAVFASLGRITIAVSILQALVWPLRHWDVMLEQRQASQSIRKVADAEVFKPHLTVKLSLPRAFALLRGTLFRWRKTMH